MKGAPSRLGKNARLYLQAGLLTLAYVVTAQLGLRLAFVNENVTTVWPPTGLALAALTLWGRRLWPAVWAGALIANLLNGAPPHVALGFSVGNTLAPLLGTMLLHRIRFRPQLERPIGVFTLVFGGGLLAMLVSATGGTATLAASGAIGTSDFAQIWLQWWIGDAMGVVLVAPLVLVTFSGGWSQLRQRGPEPFVFLAAAAVASWFIFTHSLPPNYVALVFVIVAALRFQQPGAVFATAIVAGSAIWATVTGHLVDPNASVTTNLVELQIFNGTIALASLTLAAVMGQRLRAERDLRLAASELEDRVKERTQILEISQRLARIGSFRWDAVTNTNTWSGELYRIYGMTPQDRAPSFEAYMAKIHPDFRKAVEDALDLAIRTTGHFDHDYKIVQQSGDERWVQAHGEVITDTNGDLLGIHGTCQDITERKQAEEAARSSEDQFRMLASMSPHATVVVDENGRIQLVNDEMSTLFGYDLEELIGQPVEVLVPGELRSQHAMHRTIFTEDPRRRPMGSGIELWGLRKDGSRFPIDINLSPVPTSNGVQVVAAVRDITNQRRAEQTLRTAYERERDAAEHLRSLDESKTIFLEAISHELRTPLTVIVGISSLLRSGELRVDDDQFGDLLGSLDASAQRLHALLDDLLDLDRLRRGVIKPSRRPTPIAELMARMVHNLDLGEHPVHIDAHEVLANVDPAQTERIVENLVSNALKHTPHDTPIWLRAEPADAGVLIIVEDSGPGVPKNIREKLFDPFVKDMRRHIAGTGIGLSLVDRFSKLHGGRAWVEERPGGGASFRVYLPDKLDDASAPAA